MKNLKFILTALVAISLSLLGACGDDSDTSGGQPTGGQEVAFTSSIATRATDKAWENGDEIGIYMVDKSQPISTTNHYTNKRYATTATTATGAFNPPSGEDPMYFPAGGAEYDFIAYYPYTAALGSNNTIELDVKTQTDLPAIDLMVSARVTGSETSKTVNLDFRHRLTKIVLEVENASEEPATALNVSLIGLKTKSTYSLPNDNLTDDAASVLDIAIPMTVNGSNPDIFDGEGIILPAGTVDASINFDFPGGKSYTWKFDGSQTFEKEKKYTFRFKLNKEDVQLVSPDVNGTINDWTDVPGSGPIDLTPGGAGTKASPFSIGEAKNNAGAVDAKWVKGYIIGVATPGLSRAAADVEFLIGETAAETDLTKQALVKIADTDIAAWYDFTENGATLEGTEVKVLGKLVAGVQVAVTIDEVSDHVGGIDPGTGGDENLRTIAEVRALHTGTTLTISDPDAYIEGIVVSGTNSTSKKNITIDDGTGGIAIRFMADAADGFPQGSKMKVMIDGVGLSRFQDNSVLQLNNLPNANASLVEGGAMPAAVEITALQLMSGDYESRYVAVKDVQFDAEFINKPIGNSAAHVSTTAGDANGNDFTVFVAKFADFATTNVPAGSGTLKGVAGFNANAIQMLPQMAADLAGMTGARFGNLGFASATVAPSSVIVNEALTGAKITVAYENQPALAIFTYSVTADAAWFTDLTAQTTTLTQGDGTFDIPITGTPNAEGTVTFTITSGTLSTTATLTVQASGSALPEQYFFEDMGPGSDANKVKINTYTKWSMSSPIVYSDQYGNADIRFTSTIDNALWLPGAKDSELKISGIPSNYTDITLSFKMMGNKASTNANCIAIKCNGTENATQPDYLFTVANEYHEISLSIPAGTHTIEFFSAKEKNIANYGFRIDDIKLVGTPN